MPRLSPFEQLLEDFARQNPRWSTPLGADDQCWFASIALQEAFEAAGLLEALVQFQDFDVIEVSNSLPGVPLPARCRTHWVFHYLGQALEPQFEPELAWQK